MLNYTEHYGLVTGNPRYFHGRDMPVVLSPHPKERKTLPSLLIIRNYVFYTNARVAKKKYSL
jgi:hypothetical protein